MKQGKNSNTRAWCDELNSTFKQNNISSEVITLKEYDYEASTGKDLLHEQMYKLYDADLIFFTSPINFSNPTFYLRNLLERFVHAQTKAVQKGLDIFANKRIEILPNGGCTTMDPAPKDSIWKEYEEKYYPGGELIPGHNWMHRYHKLLYEKLNFIKPLGLINLHLNTWNPQEPIGPDRNTMHGHPQTVATIDRIMEKIKTLASKLATMLIGVTFPLFSIIASWVIVHRVAEITMNMHGRLDLVVTTTVFSAVILIWLNSMVIDVTIWVLGQIDN